MQRRTELTGKELEQKDNYRRNLYRGCLGALEFSVGMVACLGVDKIIGFYNQSSLSSLQSTNLSEHPTLVSAAILGFAVCSRGLYNILSSVDS